MSVILITGAGGGMGLACVERMRAEPLLLADISSDALAPAIELAPEAHTAVVDLASTGAIDGLVGRIQELGGLRHVIHLAGVSPTMDDVDRVLRVDLIATAALVEALTPLVGAETVAVCAGSIAAYLLPSSPKADAALDDPLGPDLRLRLEEGLGTPLDTALAYSLAKRGVLRLCERLAPAWGARGARIVSISPGLIDTPMGRLELRENTQKGALVGRTPVHAPSDDGSPDLPGRTTDIADVIDVLVSPRARFISGCDLRVDGGLVAALCSSAWSPPTT